MALWLVAVANKCVKAVLSVCRRLHEEVWRDSRGVSTDGTREQKASGCLFGKFGSEVMSETQFAFFLLS